MRGILRSGIVRPMAAIAGRRCRRIVVVHVTLDAGQSCMSSCQGVVCVQRVIEGDRCPVAGVVAGVAGRGEACGGVCGVFGAAPIRLMATKAACGCALKYIAEVAGAARKSGVHSSQRVACVFEMVELGVRPTVHRVAGCARSRESKTRMIENRR